ncbi:ABC transporter permease [Olivibacter sp. SDN3]|uniref:FtsX-like permease family protein n=1 Tax=Olivibacter sp. SDN3 TaxID=2764720 RepID=UPI0016512895|nr:FtsX-like permease family protein [Olivibacter sp. SDN3]QNL50981.1 ABC transporter permease [Olivibacter sp. SDN3]
MNTNNLKIAWRAAWKTKLFTSLNILGLAIGFAGFILAYAYINRENSYDAWNENYENIYLVGLEEQGKATDLTPAALGSAIKSTIPEVEEMGRIGRAPFEVPFISNNDVFYIKNWLGADRSIAKMFAISVDGLSISKSTEKKLGILSPQAGKKLFPQEKQAAFSAAKPLALMNEESGIYENVFGISKERPLSNLEYDYIGFVDDLGEAHRDGGMNAFQTYIVVKQGTDIDALRTKINALYQQNIANEQETINSSRAVSTIYLDPLKNLHLKPKNGSDTGYKITLALGILSSVILLLACINFANLMLVQAQRRSKEIGIKKVFGISRKSLTYQFLIEVFVQCLIAACIACFLTVLSWNTMTRFFHYDLSSFDFNHTVWYQLGGAILLTTIISGLYPAIILSGYRPIFIIKGSLHKGQQSLTSRNVLLGFQFIVAFVFISTMLIINRQTQFMKESDRGFDASHVVHIKNLAIFSESSQFSNVRERMKAIPGVQSVTITTNIPGGIAPNDEEFSFKDKSYALNHLGVDFEYFETLGMDVVEGRVFSTQFQSDTAHAIVLNERAAKSLGVAQPLGETMRICDQSYKIVGIVKDSKMLGFEQLVKPTAYTLQTKCSYPNHPFKTEILAKLEGNKVRTALNALEKQWSSINTLDGKFFNYDFVDQRYAALYAQQEQLQRAFMSFTILIMLVALIGLFSMSAYAITVREKEVGIRKVLGANAHQILLLLNKPFIRLVTIAILIATPIAWWGASQWLDTFAYRIELSWWIFAVGAALTLLLVFITVSYQAFKAAIVNPVDTLRNE